MSSEYFSTSPEFAELVREAYENDDPDRIAQYINNLVRDIVADEVEEARSKMQIEINRLESENADLEKKLDEALEEIGWLNDELREEREGS